jgi:hypothetical protein
VCVDILLISVMHIRRICQYVLKQKCHVIVQLLIQVVQVSKENIVPVVQQNHSLFGLLMAAKIVAFL